MSGVLHISSTGLIEPLGRGQVLQYALALAKKTPLHLLTFERAAHLQDAAARAEVTALCAEAGIVWHPRLYRGGPRALWTLTGGAVLAVRLARRHNLRVVHCRSYLAGLMGLTVKRITGARLLFDMRGFWPDERAEAGIWHPHGLPYRAAKLAERRLLGGADHIVSLTHAGARELPRLYRGGLPMVSVIPTCTNLDLFTARPMPKGPFVLGYVGSTGSWYRFDRVAEAVAALFAADSTARFRLVTQSDHEGLRRRLAAARVDLTRVDMTSVPFSEVPAEMAKMSAGIFFIQPSWAKRASCPTRMGEFLASGRPCLANHRVGDVSADLAETGSGVAIDLEGVRPAEMTAAVTALRRLSAQPDIVQRCRDAAEARFSLAQGVAAYAMIYRRLAAPPGTAPSRPVRHAWEA